MRASSGFSAPEQLEEILQTNCRTNVVSVVFAILKLFLRPTRRSLETFPLSLFPIFRFGSSLSVTGSFCRSTDLSPPSRRTSSQIVHIVVRTAANAGIILRKKPCAAAINFTSFYSSQLPVQRDEHNSINGFALRIEHQSHVRPFLA